MFFPLFKPNNKHYSKSSKKRKLPTFSWKLPNSYKKVTYFLKTDWYFQSCRISLESSSFIRLVSFYKAGWGLHSLCRSHVWWRCSGVSCLTKISLLEWQRRAAQPIWIGREWGFLPSPCLGRGEREEKEELAVR